MTRDDVTAYAESEELHARVRVFAAAASGESFDALALAIARYQARRSPAFARLVATHGSKLDAVDEIPAVPSDAFRLTRVAIHPEAEDVVRFVTSGTTEAQRGTHPFRTTQTYTELAVSFGRAALVPAGTVPRVVALAARPTEPPSSSLGFMMALFMEHFEPERAALDQTPRWLLGPAGPDLAALREHVRIAGEGRKPLLVLATSLALVALVRALDGATLALPSGSVVMQTGGYKGRDISVTAAELRRDVARTFAIVEASVVSEYGMTELTSQLYEGTCPGAALVGPSEIYLAPPWLRVTPVDPVSLAPVPAGEVGLARFVDLGNVDSAIAVITRDRIRVRAGGIELLGREPGAPARGCSLAVEALLSGSTDALGRR